MESLSTRLREALKLDRPYLDRPRINSVGRKAAVLALFGLHRDGESSVLITKRTDSVQTHKGQMALPGGTCDPGEESIAAAVREAEEEVGIAQEMVEILGALPELSTPSGFRVTPIVGFLRVPIEEIELRTSEAEIAEAFWIPFATLTHPETYRREVILRGPIQYPVHVYQVGQYRIWGATGAILKNLLDRLEALR